MKIARTIIMSGVLSLVSCAHSPITQPEATSIIDACLNTGPSRSRTDADRFATLEKIQTNISLASSKHLDDAQLQSSFKQLQTANDHFRIVLQLGEKGQAPPLAVQRVRCGVDGMEAAKTIKEIPIWTLATYTEEIFRLGTIGKIHEAAETMETVRQIVDQVKAQQDPSKKTSE